MCPFHSTGGSCGPTKRGGCHKIQCGARAAYRNQNQRVGYTAFGKSPFRGFIFVRIHASHILFDYLGSHNRCQYYTLDLVQPPKSRLGNNGSVGRASNLLGTNSFVDLPNSWIYCGSRYVVTLCGSLTWPSVPGPVGFLRTQRYSRINWSDISLNPSIPLANLADFSTGETRRFHKMWSHSNGFWKKSCPSSSSIALDHINFIPWIKFLLDRLSFVLGKAGL